MTKITIVGGGVSGVLLAVQLIRARPNFPLSITLIEKEKNPWLGVAYSTDKVFHLLNVRAEKMSALPEGESFCSVAYRTSLQYIAKRFCASLCFQEIYRRSFQPHARFQA